MISVEHTLFKKDLLQVYFKAKTAQTQFWIGLRNSPDDGSGANVPPAVGDTMTTASAAEVIGGGYARQNVATAAIVDAANSTDWQITCPQVSFTFTSTPTTNPQASHAFLCTGANATDNTGLLLMSWALGGVRTFSAGVTENVTCAYKQT